jgi:hypothetical protein
LFNDRRKGTHAFSQVQHFKFKGFATIAFTGAISYQVAAFENLLLPRRDDGALQLWLG